MDATYPKTWRFLRGRARHALSAAECATIEAMFDAPVTHPPGTAVLRRGDVLDRSTFLIDGWMARTITRDDRRHIVALHVPGDFVDLHAFALKRLDHDLVAIGPVTVASVSHTVLEARIAENAHLGRLLWFSTLFDAAIHREWIVAMEHCTAEGRLAHILLELWYRLDFVGLAQPDSFALPLTQIELADACGTTAIHLNRIVRSLREKGLVEMARGHVRLLDKARLARLAHFEASYLYGQGELHLEEELSPLVAEAG